MISYLKKNIIYIVSYLIYFIYIFVVASDLKNKLINPSNKILIVFFLLYFSLSFLLYFFINFINKKCLHKIPLLFLIISITFCLLQFFTAPLFTGSDDHFHFYRAYEIANGNYITDIYNNKVGSSLPDSLNQMFQAGGGSEIRVKYSSIDAMKQIKLNSKKTSYYSEGYDNTALYSPVQYIPQALGIKIGMFFNLSLFNIASLARLFNIIFYVLIGYFAIKLSSRNKLFYLLVLCCPNIISLASTLSSDAFTDALIILFISLIMHFHNTNNKISLKYIILIVLLSVLIAECKIVYFPLLLMLLLLKKENFKTNKERNIFLISTFALSIISCLFWMSETTSFLNLAYDKSALQKAYILSNPFNYLIIFVKTFILYGLTYIRDLFIGNYMYNAQIIIPTFLSFAYVLIVLLSLFFEDNKKDKKTTILFAILSVIIIGLIGTALYVQCTAQFIAVKNSTIYGIQGRYFLPIIFLIPYIFHFKKKLNFEYKILIDIAIILNIIVIYYMFVHFI
jgi:uncharacterized membrane protein